MENFKTWDAETVDCFQVSGISSVDSLQCEANFPSERVVPKRAHSVKNA